MRTALVLLFSTSFALAQSPIRGFAPEQWKAEHDRESEALSAPQPERIRAYMKRMSAEPHHAGSPASLAVAEYALGLLKEWGLDARIENFEALLPYPTERVLEMVSPARYQAKLQEPPIPEDKDTYDKDQLPTYNAYSASGDVTAPLVYVNYGTPPDYEQLRKMDIDVKGRIVLARYGRSWRGVKPKLAYEHGAVGCIIYSDPRDDGYFEGDVYPRGPMRPWAGVQRGSVVDMAVASGDPLSPGWASEKGSKRLSLSEAKTLMKIPVQPISYEDALPLLENLRGPVAPESWRGALPVTYHVGPGPATVRLKLDFDWTTKPLRDVIATIPGSVYPDQWILYGNHHDAWVNGASDPISGASALLETARTLAELRKQGWQPKRTIVLALWDGEEFGLMGSTEWAEKHQDELARKAVVYINSDSNGRGAIGASGSHTLEQFMTEVLRDLKDPVSDQTLLEGARNRRRGPDDSEPAPEFRLGPLGAGSDYVAFLDHVGVASLNLGFGGADSGGVYHSIYDDFNWFTNFSDGQFLYGKALSQVMTTSILRLADAPVLPFEFQRLAQTVKRYVTEIQKLAGGNAPRLDLREVSSQLTRLQTAAAAYDQELTAAGPKLAAAPRGLLEQLNDTLFHAERALLTPEGLPGREWYRHELYAPGLYTGYGAKTLPGVREAAEAGRWDEANQQARQAARALRAMTARIEEATRLLQRAAQ